MARIRRCVPPGKWANPSKSAQWLSDLTHAERPWIEARKGLPPGARGSREITLDSMADYYATIAEGWFGVPAPSVLRGSARPIAGIIA